MSDQKRQQIQALVAAGAKAATAYGRADLAERLEDLVVPSAKPDTTIAVLGQFKQGKSSLVNSLVGAKVCAVDDDIATAVPTFVRYGENNAAWALVPEPDNPDGRREPIPLDQVGAYTTERGRPDCPFEIKGVEIEIPRKLLKNGLIFADTPGVGGLGSAYATAGLGTLSVAEIGIFVSDTSQELTQAELNYLQQADGLCSNLVFVATKIDLYPSWRDVVEINQGHLQRAGLDLEIFPVSSYLRDEAMRRSDKTINEESGCAHLVRELRTTYLQRRESSVWNKAARNVLSVCNQLSSKLEAELATYEDPAGTEALVSELEQAKARSESLQSNLARWQVTLNDGIQELTADIDHDFRQRIRAITQDSDKAIEDGDPLTQWQEFEPWLVDVVSQDVIANYRFLTQRSIALSEEVAEHFVDDGCNVLNELNVYSGDHPMSRVNTDLALEMEKKGKGANGLTLLKGSYSGMLMCTMLGSLVSVTPLAPIAVGVGLVMGRKSLKDEKARGLRQRRSEAKVAVRRYCEEVQFQVGKDSRGTCRKVSRQLRDHYTQRAEELNRSTSDALKAASSTAQSGQAERAKKIKDLTAEIGRVAELAKKCELVIRSENCLLYTSPSPRDKRQSRMPSSA